MAMVFKKLEKDLSKFSDKYREELNNNPNNSLNIFQDIMFYGK